MVQSGYAELVCWGVCFAAGLLLFLTGIFYLIRKGIHEGSLAKASLLEFIASVILYFPEEISNDIPQSVPALHIVESTVTALLRTFNIYLGNGYDRVALTGHPVFSGFYATLITLANIALLLFAGAYIIQFLDGPLQRIRLVFRKKRSAFLFPVCNEKTLAIAESIDRQDACLLFACADQQLDAKSKERIASMRGVYVDSTLMEAFSKILRKTRQLEVFLFHDDEEANLTQLAELCRFIEQHPARSTRIYVELNQTPWSLYDDFLTKYNSANGENLVVNFVRTQENFVYNDLLKHSIFRDAVPVEKDGHTVKKIGVVIAGMNERNLEMFKAILHLSQMPGYRLTILVLDEQPSGWDTMLRLIPEIQNCDKEGNALYEHHYFEGVDFTTNKPEEACDMVLPDFNFAFVNAGDDLLNLNLALRLQAYRVRRGERDGYQIQVNIRDRAICSQWNETLTKGLTIVGDIAGTYSYDFITMSDIEQATIAIHKVRYPSGDPTWISYCNNEYNRHSVYARTLSFKYKVQLIDEAYGGNYSITSTDRIWKIYEHMRWNVYTRTLGYVLADKALLNKDGELDKTVRSLAKVHNDLVDYDMLPKEEQDKDALKLTTEIVEILKRI